ncbi:zinc finger protein 136-like [Cavia porcellus]|uniref:zinc finger protein 136-like n=1 Tax=Cavia porcellus TaxID=10141 RepID=UPI002FE3EDB4
MESVTLDDVTVNFTQEEWALLKPSQKNFYRAVMQETLWNLASVGQKWQYQIIEDEYKNLNRNLRCQVLQRFFEHKENRQLGEMFIKTPNHRVNKKTSRVKQRKRHMYKEVASSPSLFPKDIIINHEHRPSEYQESTERPHECKKCDKAFKWPCDLRNHERTHTGEKPYACVQCGKTFSCSTYYRRHEQIHTGEKPFICQQCGKSFRCSSFLEIHERIHTGEKPFVCKHCAKAFTCASTLRIHERNHNGEKPYVCELCGKAFREYGKMLRHGKTHNGDRHCPCEECGRVFRSYGYLQNHIRTHTRQKS